MSQGQYQIQLSMPLTRMVKYLIVVNVSLWLGLVLILQNFFMDQPYIYQWFGLNPDRVIFEFWAWQPLTYMFMHSENVFHILFNMLVLWWFGSELEMKWGGRFFLFYYLFCGVGAAVLYLLCMAGYMLASGSALPLMVPVVGASGAMFGLMVAFGYLFGDRVIFFMMLFPMKARYFVMLIAGVELVNLLSSGVSSQVSNLAHLGGLVSGFLFLTFWNKWQGRRRDTGRHGRKLKLVVDNERASGRGPRYWN